MQPDTKDASDSSSSAGLLKALGEHPVTAGLPASVPLGHPEIRVEAGRFRETAEALKTDPRFAFDLFLSVTVVDWMDSREERFEVVYHLLSLAHGRRLRVRSFVPESRPEIPSVADLWPGADFMEREAYDMYGVRFTGHPDLRRILMWEGFEGHPLRKDYPVQAKQARVPLRAPEVRNTATDMKRPALVAINKRRAPGQNGAGVSRNGGSH